jgi:Cu/Ag efflux protein CusF
MLLFGAFVCYAGAQNQPAQPTDPSQDQYQQAPATDVQKTTPVKGMIDKIDLEKKTITLKDETTKESKVYTFNDTTTFSKKDKVMKAEDLKKGDKVLFDVDPQNMIVKVHWETKDATLTEPEKQEKQDQQN